MSDDEYADLYEDQPQFGLKVLMVAEKNSIAEALAYALGKPKAKKGRMSFFYYQSQLFGQNANFTVTATNGHLFNRDFPQEYANWKSHDPIELFNAKTIKKPSSQSAVGLLERAAKGIDYLILWLDNDREGENICFEVIDVCGGNPKILRAKFSSITPQDLQNAFRQLKFGPNLQESQSVDARQIIDLKIGVTFSRFQTMYFNQKYNTQQLVSFGPCQTPTLGFCVQRFEEIQTFIPQTFWLLKAVLDTPGRLQCDWVGQPIFKEQDIKAILKKYQKNIIGDVISVDTQKKSKVRPDGINTVQMLKFCSSYLGLGPQNAMHTAERLYLSGYISYPRTETTSYPNGFPTQQIIKALTQYDNQDIRNQAKGLINGHNNPKQGQDKGDHPPITPTDTIPQNLQGQEKGLYEYIAKMFLASHSNDCQYAVTTLKFKVGEHTFYTSGTQIIDPGFTKVATWLNVQENFFDPNQIINNNKVQIESIISQIGQTTPPDYLTETELIGLMDKHGIGTDASMATHINNICEREYVKVEGGSRKLVPTDLGISLVKGYKKIDPDLVAPQLRSNIERQVDMIAKGQSQFQIVIDEVIGLFIGKYKNFKAKISELDIQQFQKVFAQGPDKQVYEPKVISKCGVCNRFMTINGFKIECEKCQKSYTLLPNSKYRVVGNQECPLDRFQLVMMQSNVSPYVSSLICPKCFGESTIIESNQCVCNLCPAKDCQFSMIKRRIGLCSDCKIGDLVLEPYLNKGAAFSISCNECWCLYQLIPAVQNVQLSDKQCGDCNLQQLKVQQKQKDIFPSLNQDNIEVCIFCHPEVRAKLLYAKYQQEKRHIGQEQKIKQFKGNKKAFNQNRTERTERTERADRREQKPKYNNQNPQQIAPEDNLANQIDLLLQQKKNQKK